MGPLDEQTMANGARSEQYIPLRLTSKKYPNLGKVKPVSAAVFHTVERLATLEATLHFMMESVSSKSTDVSFFCREYWGSSASMAQLSLVEIVWDDALRCQVRRACVLESLSLAVLSQLSSGTMKDVSMTLRLKLRKLIYHVHANCLALLDLVHQRWLAERRDRGPAVQRLKGHCPQKLDISILIEAGRYRTFHDGEHLADLKKNSETIANILQTLCNGSNNDIVRSVCNMLQGDTSLDSLQASTVRSDMLQMLRFEPLHNDAYVRCGMHRFSTDCPAVEFEPHPPVIADLDVDSFLPSQGSDDNSSELYTLVLDLDETLVHSNNGDTNDFGTRPGMTPFIQRMSALGYELVIFTTATQDYADGVIDKIDPDGLIQHRLYRQHTLPWGPVCIKDLSRLGRDLNRTLIIDNIDDNFMLQPQNGILITDWFKDPQDRALYELIPLLEELITTRASVSDLLTKYADRIPSWAGFGELQKGSRSPGKKPSMNQPFTQARQQPTGMAYTATYVPVVLQAQPWGFVSALPSAVPSHVQAPKQALVKAQAPANDATATPESSQSCTEGAAGKVRRGIKNRKLDSSTKNSAQQQQVE